MITLTPDILQHLKCMHCRGYLNATPVVVNPNNSQVCGKCYNILPDIEKRSCVRQIGYEAVAALLLFPCRYNLQGCHFKFGVNEADSHELECPFRFSALNLSPEEPLYEDVEHFRSSKSIETKDFTTECKLSDLTGNIVVESCYTLKSNRQSPKVLKYEVTIYGNCDEKVSLCVRNSKHNHDYPVAIRLEGAVSLSPVQSVYCQVLLKEPNFSNGLENPQARELQRDESTNFPKCAKCFKIIKCEIYHCAFGHDVCKNCKGTKCSLCTTPINSVPRYCCENISKGCCVYLLYTELYLHNRDCEFREFKCLQQGCVDVSETLFALKDHIKEKHSTSVILSNQVVKQSSDKDEIWIMFAYENLFKCKRFCYDSTLEYTVEFVGPHKHAERFKFDVWIKANENAKVQLSKNATCMGWNASALDQSVIFNKSEILKLKCKPHNFTYTLNLIKILKE